MRTRSRLLSLVAVAALLTFGSAGPASAHDQLVDSSPAAGDRLQAAPTEVSLRFDADVMNIGAIVMVVDASGKDWVIGDPRIDRTDVVVGLMPGMTDAGFEVRWRVVSADGHPIAGIIPFTIGDGAVYSSTDESSTSGDTEPTAAEIQATTEQNTIWRVLLIGLGGAVIAVALYAVITFIRRRARGSSDTGGSSESDPPIIERQQP